MKYYSQTKYSIKTNNRVTKSYLKYSDSDSEKGRIVRANLELTDRVVGSYLEITGRTWLSSRIGMLVWTSTLQSSWTRYGSGCRAKSGLVSSNYVEVRRKPRLFHKNWLRFFQRSPHHRYSSNVRSKDILRFQGLSRT